MKGRAVSKRKPKGKSGFPPLSKVHAASWGLAGVNGPITEFLRDATSNIEAKVIEEMEAIKATMIADVAKVIIDVVNSAVLIEDGRLIPEWEYAFGGAFPEGWNRALFNVKDLFLDEASPAASKEQIAPYIKLLEGILAQMKRRYAKAK